MQSSNSSSLTPKGSIPIVPSLPKIGRLAQFQRDPLGLFMEVGSYGDIAEVEIMTRRIVNLQNPEYVKYVLTENSRNYSGLIHTRLLLRYWLGEGLFTSEGTKWLSQRRLMQPLFNRQQVMAYGDLIVETVKEFPNLMPSTASVDMMELMMNLTVRVAARTLFSTDLGQDAHEFSKAVTELVHYYGNILRSGWLVILPDKSLTWSSKFRKPLATLNSIVSGIIKERRSNSKPYNDLLARLMEARDIDTGQGMSDEELRDEIMTMLFAGHETTAGVMTWAWYLLSKHTEIRDKVRTEARTLLQGQAPQVSDLGNLPYATCVLQEVMRLYPPVWGIFRNTLEEGVVGGFTIKTGTRILISPYVMHRNPMFFPEPDAFRPDRFNPENISNLPKFAYLPFGAGPRQCIGQHMAMVEMQIALAYMIQHFDFNLVGKQHIEPEALLTLRPKEPVLMEIKPLE